MNAAGAGDETAVLEVLRLGVEQSAGGMLITDLDGRIRYANPAAERLYGYGQGGLDGAARG